MCITEYDEERTLAEKLEEGRIEGREEGMETGALKTLIELVKEGILSLSDAAARAHMSVEESERKAAVCDAV